MLREIKNTEEAIDLLTRWMHVTEEPYPIPTAVDWAPGDMTKYTVAFFKMRSMNDPTKIVDVLMIVCGAKVLVVPAPLNEFSQYSAESFLRRFGEDRAGWWAGVRPLLAGLGWTQSGDRETTYSPGDNVHMTHALQRLGYSVT